MGQQSETPKSLHGAACQEGRTQQRGQLKIFFGYGIGTGKTYAMLKAAQDARKKGIDVAVGCVESHGRPEIAALLQGFDIVPEREFFKDGRLQKEIDLDGVLARRPQLVLADELAHINGEGCRHTRRCQDVEELLKNGINVYTTVDVENIESLNDKVTAVTGCVVRERIPDSVFDEADQVELVDIEPRELMERIQGGKISFGEQNGERSLIFTLEKFTALREIALRRCADRVNLLTERAESGRKGDYHTDEHILVCLSSAPSNAKIIRTAARMAAAFRGVFTALFVETPDFGAASEEDKKRLRANIQLAGQLGAKIETVQGDDVPYQIAEFARLSGVSKIVIGRSTATRRHFFSKPTLTEKLIVNAPNLDIHIIPDSSVNGVYHGGKEKRKDAFRLSLADTGKSIAILLLATAIGMAFSNLGFTEANIITVYILAVLIIAIATTYKIYSLISSIVSVLVFNFLFTVPRYTLRAYEKGYPVTFLVMFLAAFITGTLAGKLKSQARQSARAAYRTKILFDTNQLLQQAEGKDAIINSMARQLIKLLGRDIVVYTAAEEETGESRISSPAEKKLSEPHIFPAGEEVQDKECTSGEEKAVADWVFKNNKHAGATTDTMSNARCLYYAIRVNSNVYGVIGIVTGQMPLDVFENSVLLSILGECALALENEKNMREKEEAAILAQNEQLRANLLRAISHDLRTPLTSISGNASNLLSSGGDFDDATKRQIYMDIYDDSMWLINLVENLLSVTRLEDGRMHLHLAAELMDDVIAEALQHVSRKSSEHQITVESSSDLILAQIDAKLIVQVIINIVDNAVKYTPRGSHIRIRTEHSRDEVAVTISDDGPGISDELKPRIFDMFFSGANKIADSRRSLGLGLFLCKSIINAHGGSISVRDNEPHGTVFTFTLPAKEVPFYE